MTNSSIEITFVDDATAGEYVEFTRENAGITHLQRLDFITTARTKVGEIQIPTATGTPGEATAEAYEKYFINDYDYAGIYTVSRSINVVTIELPPEWTFQDYSATANATDVITAGIPETYVLDGLNFQPATNVCDEFDLNVQTSEITETWRRGSTAPVTVSSDDFTITLDRAISHWLILENAGGTQIRIPEDVNKTLFVRKVIEENIYINVSPNELIGATVNINVTFPNQAEGYPYDLNLTYSLDGVAYQASKIFTGQLTGSYTVYVKDNFGCIVTKDFEITDSGTREPFFEVSPLNSVGFSKSEVWNQEQDGIHKNDKNTLSTSEITLLNYQETLLYAPDDVIRIQFKSNFDTNEVWLEQCESESSIVVEKMSSNLNRFEALDGRVYYFRPGYAGIYFDNGNTYNQAGTPTGTYALNGNLPDFAKKGQTIKVGTTYGIQTIYDVLFDDEIGKWAIIFEWETATSIVPNTQIVESYYDLLPFEVYEFDVDFSQVPVVIGDNILYRIRIDAADPVMDNESHYSENISLEGDLTETVAIRYYNENNRDIFYLYGITHFFRIPILAVEAYIEGSSEATINDLTNTLVESEVNDGNRFVFDAVTRNTLLKLYLALSSEHVFINGEGYIKGGEIRYNNIENTNLYELTAEMVKTNTVFDISIEGETGAEAGADPIYIPGLLEGDSGFIKI